MEIVHEIGGADNKSVEEREALKTACRAVQQVVRMRLGRRAGFAAVEEATLAVLNEVGQTRLQTSLQDLADRQPKRFRFNGQSYHAHEPGEVTYHSLCGPVVVRRHSYRRIGTRNSETLVPLELVAGLLERTTPAMASSLAKGYAKGPTRAYHEEMIGAHRCPPSRSTLERVAGRLATAVRESIDELEPLVRCEEELPDKAHALSIGLDRTTVPMAEPSEDRSSGKKAPVRVQYRMAYVGTVAIHDREGEPLATYRYAVGAHEDPTEMVDRMMADVHQALAQKRLHVGVVQDGAAEMWGLLWDGLKKVPLVGDYYQVIDRYHLNERLAAALQAFEPNPGKRATRLRQWNENLDRSDQAIHGIVRTLWCELRKATKQQREQLKPQYSYVAGFQSRMRYASLRRRGLPVGSGITEGACKSLITARTKRSGQRWSRAGVAAVLALRTLYQCQRLDAYWPRFVRRQTFADIVGT